MPVNIFVYCLLETLYINIFDSNLVYVMFLLPNYKKYYVICQHLFEKHHIRYLYLITLCNIVVQSIAHGAENKLVNFYSIVSLCTLSIPNIIISCLLSEIVLEHASLEEFRLLNTTLYLQLIFSSPLLRNLVDFVDPFR